MPSHTLNDSHISSQSIFLHSNDAVVSISDAEKIFYLQEAIQAPAGYRLVIGLTNLTMPNSMYNIVDGKNTITISNNDYTIAAGNYSAEDLVTAINAKITAIGSVSFDDIDNNFTFTFTDPQNIQSTTMERQLGLGVTDNLDPDADPPETAPHIQLPTGAVSSYTARNICDLGGTTNIYIRIRNLTMNNLDSRGRTNNIIASIVNNTNYGGYIFFVPPEVLYYQITEQSIGHLDIELTDQEGELVNLNGANFNITLTVHYVKQREGVFRNTLLREIRETYTKMKDEEKKNPS